MGQTQGRMTVEQYRAHLQGRINRAQGKAFEEVIDASCLHYRMVGAAHIEKTPEPMKIIQVLDRARGIFKAVFEKPAQPDYKGTMQGGRSACFDTKFTSTDRIRQDAVTQDQWDALDEHEAMGAFCFIVVSLGYRAYRVPWERWKSMQKECGHKYMNAEDLGPYEVPYENGVIRFLDLPKATREYIDHFFGER